MPKRRQASVRFAPQTQIYLVPILQEEIAASELGNIWYDDEEFAKMQKDMKRTIRAMRKQLSSGGDQVELDKKGRPLIDGEESKLSSRGLEHLRSAAHLEQRKINKDCVTGAVFGEQRRQWDLGVVIVDDEAIAKAARRASEWARQSARRLGEMDEMAAWGDRFCRRGGGGGERRVAGNRQLNAPRRDSCSRRSALETAVRLASDVLARSGEDERARIVNGSQFQLRNGGTSTTKGEESSIGLQGLFLR